MYDSLGDFLTVASIAIYQQGRRLTQQKECEKSEAQYMEVIGKQENPTAFSEALGILMQDFETRGASDFLGEVIGCLGQLDKGCAGQVFTPWHLAKLCADMTVGSVEKPDPNKRLTIQEPACGAGAMALAVGDALMYKGFYPKDYYVDCTDLDARCFRMAHIQLSLAGIPAMVRQGNTLTLKTFQELPTLALQLFPHKQPRKSNPAPKKRRNLRKKPCLKKIPK